jgi:hypothetical protein
MTILSNIKHTVLTHFLEQAKQLGGFLKEALL